jgi:uncharacterized protein
MGNALQDQLLKSGLVNDKQLKKVQKEKRKEDRQDQGRKGAPDPEKVRAQQAQAEKAERDRELNRQRQQSQQEKAVAAQIRQIIEANRQSQGGGDLPYNFADDGKVKRMYVSAPVREQIVRGRLVIVRMDNSYELVSAEVAEKLRARCPACIVLWNESSKSGEQATGEDPYAKYDIPDDLMW